VSCRSSLNLDSCVVAFIGGPVVARGSPALVSWAHSNADWDRDQSADWERTIKADQRAFWTFVDRINTVAQHDKL
jgi:hypothetical protein